MNGQFGFGGGAGSISRPGTSSRAGSVGSIAGSATMSPQGTFVQRLCQLEEENKRLRNDLREMLNWRVRIEEYLTESFGYFDPTLNVSSGIKHSIQSVKIQ